ncbi:MAG: DUF3021 family protein [Lachnospiraceae bacterium]|nr:DUF3021 family protein [Lachnospiraceae bacterium]
MKTLKLILFQGVCISFGILVLVGTGGVIDHFLGENTITFDWYQPMSFVFCGFLGALATLVLTNLDKLTIKQLIVRVVFHCLMLYAAVSFCGYIFKWYSNLYGFIGVSLGFFVIYGFVWFATGYFTKMDEKEINEALNDIRDLE